MDSINLWDILSFKCELVKTSLLIFQGIIIIIILETSIFWGGTNEQLDQLSVHQRLKELTFYFEEIRRAMAMMLLCWLCPKAKDTQMSPNKG